MSSTCCSEHDARRMRGDGPPSDETRWPRCLDRRHLLYVAGSGPVLALGLGTASSAREGLDAEEISQPTEPGAAAFMERAFEMRQAAVDSGDRPYGAVIVRGDKIVGQSGSRVILDHDPTAHAELATIRVTARRLQPRSLSGLVMYSSSRPCPMCEAAAYWAGIDRMIHGRDLADAGTPQLCG